jgi:protein-disulfide isomerase
MRKFNIKRIPTWLFVIFSLAIFCFIGILYFWASLPYYYIATPTRSANDRYYFQTDSSTIDPLITKNPNLSDMLAGPIITSADPSLGDTTASVAIVEFADFACDYCYREEQSLRQIVNKYQDKIFLVWKDYPESDKTSVSYQAAVAARCADNQVKFWPYHDLLFAQKNDLNRDKFISLAQSLGLDMNSFIDCLDREKTAQSVDDNIEEANALDINGVPFIFINDQQIMGEASLDDIEKIIGIELGEGNK